MQDTTETEKKIQNILERLVVVINHFRSNKADPLDREVTV